MTATARVVIEAKGVAPLGKMGVSVRMGVTVKISRTDVTRATIRMAVRNKAGTATIGTRAPSRDDRP